MPHDTNGTALVTAMVSRLSQSANSTPGATQLLQQGQDAYANKRYEEALQNFNKALAASNSHAAVQLQIMDHQVGVHVKLKRLDDALISAKAMIRCDRTDARGYLRCGQVQRLQEDYEAACKWYEHGLGHVKPNDRLRPTLASSFEKIREQAAQQRMHSKPCDPTTCLPLEVVRMILGYLDYKEHVSLLRVSKPWRKLLSGLPPVSDTLDFSRARGTVSYNMLRAAVRRLTGYPKRLQLAMLSDPATKYLNDRLGPWCKKPLMQHCEVNDARIDLKQISWSTIPLRTLTLGWEASVKASGLDSILQQCGHLQTVVAEFAVTDPRYLLHFPPSFNQPYLEKLILSGKIQFTSLSCFPNLVHLGYRELDSTPLVRELDLVPNSKLRYVEISAQGLVAKIPQGVQVMKASAINGFMIEAPCSLRHLELRCHPSLLANHNQLLRRGVLDQVRTFAVELEQSHTDFDQADIDFLFTHCSNLEHARFKLPLRGDSDFGKLVGTTPRLRSLIIEDAQITGAFLADLCKVKSCRVESVSLRACSEVSSDTWDWLRQRGIMVDVRSCSERHGIFGGRRLIDLR